MTPVCFLNDGDKAHSIQGWAEFVFKGNQVISEAYEYFKTMRKNELVVVYMDNHTLEPVSWKHVIRK